MFNTKNILFGELRSLYWKIVLWLTCFDSSSPNLSSRFTQLSKYFFSCVRPINNIFFYHKHNKRSRKIRFVVIVLIFIYWYWPADFFSKIKMYLFLSNCWHNKILLSKEALVVSTPITIINRLCTRCCTLLFNIAWQRHE